MKVGAPVIGLNDSGGARIQEGVESAWRATPTSSCATRWPAAWSRRSAPSWVPAPAARCTRRRSPTSSSWWRTSSYMFITGPDVIKTVTARGGDEGRARRRARARREERRGALHGAGRRECLAQIRELLGFLPREQPRGPAASSPHDDPVGPRGARARRHDPAESNKPYDIKRVITATVDDGYLFEVHEHYAKNMVVGFARIGGRPVGMVANQPAYLAGVLDIDASVKAARFVRFCDCFNIPIVTLVDVPGFLPGVDQEHRGIIMHGAKLLYAFCEATVPKLTVITRKAYGGAYDVMSSQAHPRRRELRVPHGGDRGDGSGRRGQHRVPPGDRRGRGQGRHRGQVRRGVPREVRQSVQGGRARLRRRGDLPAGDAAAPATSLEMLARKRARIRRRSTATSRSRASGRRRCRLRRRRGALRPRPAPGARAARTAARPRCHARRRYTSASRDTAALARTSSRDPPWARTRAPRARGALRRRAGRLRWRCAPARRFRRG